MKTLIYTCVFIVGLSVFGKSGDSKVNDYDFVLTKGNLDYVLWNLDPNCGVRRALNSSIKVCVQGQVSEIAKAKISRAIGLWLEPLRELNSDVTQEVELSCAKADMYVSVYPGSGTEMGGPGRVNIYEQSHFGSVLHEFGHAFACLGDTYVGSMAGVCQSGQPHSIMCDGLLREDLSADDIVAIGPQFRQAFGTRPQSSFVR